MPCHQSLQFLMKQSTADIDSVQKTFNLTEQEKYLLLEAAVGEGLFFAGKTFEVPVCFIYHVNISYYIYNSVSIAHD